MKTSGHFTFLVAASVLLVLLCPDLSHSAPILHEYVPPPGANRTARLHPRGQLPRSIKMDGRTTVPRPQDPDSPTPGERVHGPRRHKPSVRLDRETTHDGVLRYSAVFNPSVVPFKRNVAYDTVKAGYSLNVGDSTLREVRITRTAHSPDRDLFWGSLAVDLVKGQPVSIPSVAPSARILNYTVKPAVALRFFRDSADNFWVRSNSSKRVRLVFLTDAPGSYLSPRIPSVTRAQMPPQLRPRLPDKVARAAQRVIRHLKIRSDESLYWQLSKLISYFRSFKAGVLKRVTGDTYLDIAFSKRGVCRHRAFAFVVTAHGLGIPARYVNNEAHAFAEAYVPRAGWIRVDLGGASSELQVSNAEQRLIHSPAPDPFPQPTRFSSSYSQLRGRVTGLRQDQRRGRSAESVRRGHGRAGAPLRSSRISGSAAASRAAGGRRTGTAAGSGEPGAPSHGLPAPPPRLPVNITLEAPTRTVLRGEAVQVKGKVDHRGAGVKGLTVKVFLGQAGQPKYVIGTLVTGDHGQFGGTVAVPRDVEVGEYQVYASTPGSGRYGDALSN